MDYDELFDAERDRTNEIIAGLKSRGDTLEQQLTTFAAEVKTYQFLITRIMVEQRELGNRISDLEAVCASLALQRLGLRSQRDAEEK